MLCLAEANLATVTVNDGETSSILIRKASISVSLIMLLLLAFYRLVYIFWAGMMPAFFYAFINVRVITPAVWRNNH
jgi:hypothetical protein